MKTPIVSFRHPITLVGAGQATGADLKEALSLGSVCVAADGGAALALRCGVMPEAVLGDLDSLSAEEQQALGSDRVHFIDDQDTTDFDKALAYVAAPLLIGVGFLGGRLDHELAVLSALLAAPHRPCILVGERDIVCLAPPALTINAAAGDVVSLYPLVPCSGESRGLRWPIDGLVLAPGGRLGTSNAALGPFSLALEAPGLLLILPRYLLPELAAQLLAPGQAGWPAPPE